MTLSNLLVSIVVCGAVLTLVAFPDFRKKLKCLVGGFLNVFIEDTAKTPEGAEAIYNQAIAEKQDAYNKADDTLKRLSGRLHSAVTDYNNAVKGINECESKARSAMQHNDEETARVFAEKRQEWIAIAENGKRMIDQLKPTVAQARHIFEQRDKELREIKRKKVEVIQQLKFNKDMAEAYDDLDELRKDTASKQLLGAIDEECKAGSERAVGAKIVHEAKLSTKVNRANSEVGSYETDDFLDSLKNPGQKAIAGNKFVEINLDNKQKIKQNI